MVGDGVRALSHARGLVLGATLIAGLGCVRNASASSAFPSALKTALDAHFPGQTFCVPLCTACHNTTKGGPLDLNVFGHNFQFHGPILTGDRQAYRLTDELAQSFMTAPGPGDPQVNGKWDSDGDGISDEDELQEYSSPSIAGPRGEHAFCPDIAYGCGARVASAPPPTDRIALLAAGLAVLGASRLRVRRPRPAR